MLLAYFPVCRNRTNPLIRRQVLLELGGFDETLTSAQDWEMYIRVASRYPFAVVPKPQVLYRQSANSMSMNVRMKEAAATEVINGAFAQAPETLQYLNPEVSG